MGKILRTNCPICDSSEYKVKFFRDFSQMLTIAPFKRYDVVKCENCGMIYANNIEESVPLNDYYEKMSKYDCEYSINFSKETHIESNQLIVKISSAHISKDSAVLDVGCGAGGLLKCFKENGFTNLTGIEPSDKNCEFIKKAYNINAFNRSIGGGMTNHLVSLI